MNRSNTVGPSKRKRIVVAIVVVLLLAGLTGAVLVYHREMAAARRELQMVTVFGGINNYYEAHRALPPDHMMVYHETWANHPLAIRTSSQPDGQLESDVIVYSPNSTTNHYLQIRSDDQDFVQLVERINQHVVKLLQEQPASSQTIEP